MDYGCSPRHLCGHLFKLSRSYRVGKPDDVAEVA